MVASERLSGTLAGAMGVTANGRRCTSEIVSKLRITQLLDAFNRGAVSRGVNCIGPMFCGVVVTSKAAAELPFGRTQGRPHSKVDCAGGGGVLGCDLAMRPGIEGGGNE